MPSKAKEIVKAALESPAPPQKVTGAKADRQARLKALLKKKS